MHEHKECEHELKYCSKCDTVYCEKCQQEWTKKANWTIRYGDSWSSGGLVTVPLNHTHDN